MLYGTLVQLGGITGYLTKARTPSLSAGMGFGLALPWSAWAMRQGKIGGWYAGVGLTGALALHCGWQLLRGAPPMLAG